MILSIPSATALGQLDVAFAQVDVEGTHTLTGEILGTSISANGAIEQGWIRGHGRTASVTTTNHTLIGAGGLIGREIEPGGDTFHYTDFTFESGPSASGPQLAIFHSSNAATTATIGALQTSLVASPIDRLQETPWVNNARPVYGTDVGDALQATTEAPQSLRVEGSFKVSIWAWNFTIADADAHSHFITGSYRQPVQPGLPANALYTEFAQVAQLEIADGSLEIQGLSGAQILTFAKSIQAEGQGRIIAQAATSLATDDSGLQLTNSVVEASGRFESSSQRNDESTSLQLLKLEGNLTIDGRQVSLGRNGPLQPATKVADSSSSSLWIWPLGLIALILFPVVIKGPALTGRFNRIQMRFDSQDYLGVLDRIEAFTQRPKYARRASFLKAVSLLSLGEFKEASLYLQTLAPHKAPEPATRSFLQACAAAGLGQDSTAIGHLSECFKNDPSYIEEAKTVPALIGYLPYFSINPEEAVT